MINTYDTPDFRETIEYKGNQDVQPTKFDFSIFNQVEAMICADLQITIRCQQIFFLMQMLYFFLIHMAYLIIPKEVFLSSPLLYIFSLSLLVVQAFQINISPNTVKRFPINLILFSLGSFARIFVYLFISEYFAISKFLLLNLMAVSLIIYIRFKAIQQSYHTYYEVNQIKNSFQLDETLINQVPENDLDEYFSNQEDVFKQEKSQDQEEEEEEEKDSEGSFEQEQSKSKGQKSDIQNNFKNPMDEDHQKQEQSKQIEVTPLSNIMDFKIYLYNYVTATLVPCFLWAFFNFSKYQLFKVLIFNMVYLTIMWIHCKTYHSIRRIFVLIYNMENAYLLLTSYFDSDMLCPWWLIYELYRLSDKSNSRKTRLSFN